MKQACHRVVAVSREQPYQIVAVGWRAMSLIEAHNLKCRLNWQDPEGIWWELRHDKYLIGKEIEVNHEAHGND